jgi:3-oxoacyl-(acyl-carrier-protein) synthase
VSAESECSRHSSINVHFNSLDYVPNKGIEMNIDAAMSATFGFGGHNGAIIIKKVK